LIASRFAMAVATIAPEGGGAHARCRPLIQDSGFGRRASEPENGSAAFQA